MTGGGQLTSWLQVGIALIAAFCVPIAIQCYRHVKSEFTAEWCEANHTNSVQKGDTGTERLLAILSANSSRRRNRSRSSFNLCYLPTFQIVAVLLLPSLVTALLSSLSIVSMLRPIGRPQIVSIKRRSRLPTSGLCISRQ